MYYTYILDNTSTDNYIIHIIEISMFPAEILYFSKIEEKKADWFNQV